MFKNCSESTVEMIQFVRSSGVIAEGKSVWHCSYSGVVSGTVYGSFCLKQSSLRVDRDEGR